MDFYEHQAFGMRNRPGLSIADGQFIDQWVLKARTKDQHRITTWVTTLRAENRAKARNVLERIDQLQDEFVTLRKRAERNEVPWGELAKKQRQLNSARIGLEKVHESLVSSEATNDRREADPVGYWTEFYGRFPNLNDRRPNLAMDLAEDQRKRGVEAIL